MLEEVKKSFIKIFLDFNSVFLLGGISVVVVGGLIYWFMNKSDEEEVKEVNLEDLLPDTSNLIEVNKKYK
jgi:hypothetical protein